MGLEIETRMFFPALLAGALVLIALGAVLFAVGLVLPFAEARLSSGRPRTPIRRSTLPTHPTIDVVIPAYLESTVIGATLECLREQVASIGAGSRVIVVASDEATARVAEAHGASVLRCEPLGKPAAVNLGVRSSTADVILLSDANCCIGPDDWPARLIERLQHADLVSAVKMEAGKREETYWKYEKAVKRFGGEHHETLSVIGEFLAFRREQFEPLPAGVLADDLQMAEDFALRGLSVQVCPDIETIEPPTVGADQIERRVRISAGHWAQAIPRWRELMRHPAGRQFLAHKGYRMSIGALGFWLAVLGAALVWPPVSTVVVVAAVVFAWVAYRSSWSGPWIVRLFSTVVVLQSVTVLGLVRALRRRLAPAPQYGWKKVAR